MVKQFAIFIKDQNVIRAAPATLADKDQIFSYGHRHHEDSADASISLLFLDLFRPGVPYEIRSFILGSAGCKKSVFHQDFMEQLSAGLADLCQMTKLTSQNEISL